MSSPIRLAVLLSGSGRTLQNFLDRSAGGALKARVVKVVSSRPDAYGLVRAQEAGVPTAVVRRRDFPDIESFSRALTEQLDECEPDLVALAGFMCYYRVPERYINRMMNIHPALLPSFGGPGFYGDRVHEAVLRHGCKVSGCTVHFVDNVYDHGPIIVQRAVEVEEDDDAHSLAARVFEQELEAYPEAVNLFADGRLKVERGVVRVLPAAPQG
jgi:formyltetrahydrofolate-dependent phosphoribosylglycinamide formyltransferase